MLIFHCVFIAADYLILKYFQNKNFNKFAWIQDPLKTIVPPKFACINEENIVKLFRYLEATFGRKELTDF